MARIRTVKPDLWHSEDLADVSLEARLTFIGLITQADDDGRMKGSPRRIKGKVFPYDSFTPGQVDGWLTELADQGLIVRFEHSGSEYIELPTWHKHQKINRKTDSALPSHSDPDSVITHGALTEDSLPEGKGREGIKEGKGVEGNGQERARVREVAGRKITDEEHRLAFTLITAFGQLAQQRFTPENWIEQVVPCLRAHPELTETDHLAIVRSTLAAPWWEGAPTPSVVYSKVSTFERALAGWRGGGPVKAPDRANEIAEMARQAEIEERQAA